MMNVFSLEAVGTAYSDSSMSLQSMAWVDAPTSMPGTQLFVWAGRVSWKLNVDLSSKVAQAFCGELRSDFLRLESLMPLQSRSRTESVMPAWEPKSFRLERAKWNLFCVWKVGCDEIRQQPVYVWHGQPRLASSMRLMNHHMFIVHDRSQCRVHTIHPRGSEASQPDAWDLFPHEEEQWFVVKGGR